MKMKKYTSQSFVLIGLLFGSCTQPIKTVEEKKVIIDSTWIIPPHNIHEEITQAWGYRTNDGCIVNMTRRYPNVGDTITYKKFIY